MAWILFGRRQPPAGSTRQAFLTGLLGSAPLFGLSVLGYLAAVWMALTGDMGAISMAGASVVVCSFFATMILYAGLVCTAIITVMTRPR